MAITTKLQGGIGNQIFQFSMGLSQARRLGTELIIDIHSFKNDPKREYTLSLFPRITNKIVDDAVATINEKGMPYNQDLVDRIKNGDVLNGFWQTEKFFMYPIEVPDNFFYLSISDELKNLLQPGPLDIHKRNRTREILGAKNSTFLVVRRTDYVGNNFHGEMTIDYYNNALLKIHQLTGEAPTVFVFSDEPEWCADNLKLDYDFVIAGTWDRTVKGKLGREDADLYLMSLCKNAVMANSSFAWWGAWLGDDKRYNNKGVVIAPEKWFGPASKEDPRDIVPQRWIKI